MRPPPGCQYTSFFVLYFLSANTCLFVQVLLAELNGFPKNSHAIERLFTGGLSGVDACCDCGRVGGTGHMAVEAVDEAGNVAACDIAMEILQCPAPVVVPSDPRSSA